MSRDGKSMHLQPSISAEPVGFPWHISHGTAAGMLRGRENFELELGISCTRGTFSPSSHAEVQQAQLARCLGDQSIGAVRISKSVGASGNRDGCLLRCSFGKRRCYWVETALSARVGWWCHSCCRKHSPGDSFVDLESGRCSTHGIDAGIGCR